MRFNFQKKKKRFFSKVQLYVLPKVHFLVVLMQKKSQPSALQNNNNIFKHEKREYTLYTVGYKKCFNT